MRALLSRYISPYKQRACSSCEYMPRAHAHHYASVYYTSARRSAGTCRHIYSSISKRPRTTIHHIYRPVDAALLLYCFTHMHHATIHRSTVRWMLLYSCFNLLLLYCCFTAASLPLDIYRPRTLPLNLYAYIMRCSAAALRARWRAPARRGRSRGRCWRRGREGQERRRRREQEEVACSRMSKHTSSGFSWIARARRLSSGAALI